MENGEELEEVNQFKYLGATLKKYGSSEGEIRIRIAIATSARVRLDKIWTSKKINFTLKYNLYNICKWTSKKLEDLLLMTLNLDDRRIFC